MHALFLILLLCVALWVAGTLVYVFCRAFVDAFDQKKIAEDEARLAARQANQAAQEQRHRDQAASERQWREARVRMAAEAKQREEAARAKSQAIYARLVARGRELGL